MYVVDPFGAIALLLVVGVSCVDDACGALAVFVLSAADVGVAA